MVIAVLVAIAATSAESLRAAPPVVTSPGPPRGLMVELLTRPADTRLPGFLGSSMIRGAVLNNSPGESWLSWQAIPSRGGIPAR